MISRANLVVLLLAAAAALTAATPAAFSAPGWLVLTRGESLHRLELHRDGVDHLNYVLYVPPDYDRSPGSTWPLILFLHGSEQRGDDPVRLQEVTDLTLVDVPGAFPFIAVYPQCPDNTLWPPAALKDLLDAVEASLRIDRTRVYLTGVSMGGYGTWQMAAAYPDLVAAIAPLSAVSDVPDVPRLRAIPTWVFHGALDRNVPVTESRRMTAALESAGADVRLTIYPNLGHDCWRTTYRDSRLYLWFLSHTKTQAEGSGAAPPLAAAPSS